MKEGEHQAGGASASPRPWVRVEEGLLALVLGAMVILPVLAVFGRWVGTEAFAGANLWVQSLNLWLAFIGAVAAARTHEHLSLSTQELFKLQGLSRDLVVGFTGAVATAVTALLAKASLDLMIAERASSVELPGGVPMWVVQLVMPLGFLGTALRFAWHSGDGWKGRAASLLAVGLVASLALVPPDSRDVVVWGGSAVLLGAVALGAPIFTVLGGFAMLLFYGQPLPVPLSAVPAETFRLVASPTLPALPLFTLAGYLLAEGGASRRLVALFREWFGWFPGGIAAAAILVCAFFTTFTGASGVTILALGALLLPPLLEAGYSERYAIGLLTASGSIGLLFPPSLPVILYGVVSHVPIDALFLSGVVPGTILVVILIVMSMIQGRREGVTRQAFDRAKALRTAWGARWEIFLPVLVLVGIFGGFLTIFEAAAFSALYAFITEVVVHRDLHIVKDVPRVFAKCATLMGGVLVILGVALGLTSYLVDAEIPAQVTAWVQESVSSKVMFILMLNGCLLIVGCLMDIFSAIMVVVPLIAPIAHVFGIDPIHLGILFLANLELGYLTPPVGMNLFMASYRFEKPLTQVYRMALPFLAVLGVGVLLIAYVPSLTLWPHGDQAAAPPISLDDVKLDDAGGGVGPRPGGTAERQSDGAAALPLGEMNLEDMLADEDLDEDDELGVGAPTGAAKAPADDAADEPAAGADPGEPPAAETAPPPFSADAIRAATPAGRTYVFESGPVAGPRERRVTRFVEVDAAGAQLETGAVDASGRPVGALARERVTWADLVGHATYPASATTITEARAEVPAGAWPAKLYTVREDGGARVTRAWFAKALPGAPVRHEVEVDGVVVSRSVLLEHRAGR